MRKLSKIHLIQYKISKRRFSKFPVAGTKYYVICDEDRIILTLNQ